MKTQDNTAAFDVIDNHFENYARTTTEQTTLDGFVTWAWDVRDQMIEALKGGDTAQTCKDIIYSIEAQAQRESIIVPSEQEATAWLMANRNDLINALTESLED
jgi:hypothetical protein